MGRVHPQASAGAQWIDAPDRHDRGSLASQRPCRSVFRPGLRGLVPGLLGDDAHRLAELVGDTRPCLADVNAKQIVEAVVHVNADARARVLGITASQSEPSAEAVMLPADAMADALRQVVRAASTDDARAVLTGVLLASDDDGLRMVATDSYRLAVRDLPDSGVLAAGQKVLIPGRALNELQRLLGDVEQLQVRLGDREATFEAGGTRLSTRLIEGEFPNYRNLLPTSYPNLLTVGKAAMIEAIRRVKILAQDSTPVRLALGGDTVRLTAITQDVGNAVEEIDASYDGTEMTVAFNPDYLAAGIDAIDADEVTLATMDPMKPAVLRGVGRDDYLYLLMPVRVP